MKLAVISDLHANAVALEAVYNDIELNECEKILVLGDLVGYYYDASYVVNKIRKDPRCIVIKGNHEEALFRAINETEFATYCFKKYGSGINIAMNTLSVEQLDWLKSLPESKSVEFNGVKIGLFHGSDKFINEYIYPDVSEKRLNKIDEQHDFLLFGHTHYPVIFPRKNHVVVNPGSVGQPRDIGSLASYAIINLENSSVVFKRVPFRSKELQNKAKATDSHYPYLNEILKRNNPYAKY